MKKLKLFEPQLGKFILGIYIYYFIQIYYLIKYIKLYLIIFFLYILATVDIETVKKAINRKKSNNISNIFNAGIYILNVKLMKFILSLYYLHLFIGIIRPKRLPAKCKKNTSDIKDDEVEQPIISGNITIFTLGEVSN